MTSFRPRIMQQQTFLRLIVTSLFCLVSFSPMAAYGQCGDNDPAFPVPENRGIVQLWPDNFRPGEPGDRLPSNRDSSDYLSTTIPGNTFGHELFMDLDIVGDFVYVAYNAGFQIWNVAGSRAEDPNRVFFRDGWEGDFESFPNPGEADTFTEAIAAHPDGNDVLIVLSGKDPVGPSFWRHTSTGGLIRLGQDQTTVSRDVAMGVAGNDVYAFVASPDDGIVVYDAAGSGFPLGSLANDTLAKRHVETLTKDGKLWVAGSNGTAIRLKIWEVPNPAFPGTAVERFNGNSLGSGARDLALFEHNGTAYMAIVQQRTVKIYDIDNCLDSNGCTSVGNPVWSRLMSGTPNEEFLSFSRSADGTPYLYYGYQSNTTAGTKKESLFNLATLGGSNAITEITDGGGTYTDGCGNTVDYWGDYYDGNEHGLRNMSPRAGMFKGNFFYRAGRAVFDVHVLDGAPAFTPVITTNVTTPAPHWMSTGEVSHPISMSATESNCSGSGTWTWNENDTLSGVSGSSTTATLTSNLCGGTDCSDRQVQVWALKSTCAGDPELIENRATVTVMDPRAQIRALNQAPTGAELPVGTVFNFSADVDGKSPFTYSWSVRDQNGAPVPGATGSQAAFEWDTSNVDLGPTCAEDPACIFRDGFNVGHTLAWNFTVNTSADGNPVSFEGDPVAAGQQESATFSINLTVTNLSGTVVKSTNTQVTLVPPGPLGFGAPPIIVTDQGGGSFQFEANSLNATQWRWTIQDVGGNQVFEWGVEDSLINYSWEDAGTFQVTVEIRNTETLPGNELSASTSVTVSNPTPLDVTAFAVDGVSSPGCSFNPIAGWACKINQPVRFTVSATGGPTEYEFDWDGNGTFDQKIAVGGLFSHTYTSLGAPFTPRVRAVKGSSTSAPRSAANEIDIIP